MKLILYDLVLMEGWETMQRVIKFYYNFNSVNNICEEKSNFESLGSWLFGNKFKEKDSEYD